MPYAMHMHMAKITIMHWRLMYESFFSDRKSEVVTFKKGKECLHANVFI